MVPLLFNVLCAASLVALMLLVLQRSRNITGVAWALVFAAVISGFFGNMDRLQSLALSPSRGFEAKTRELQTTLDKANATVASLNQLAVALAKLEVNTLASEGRFRPSSQYLDAQKEALIEQLKTLGLSDAQLSNVAAADRHWITFDYAFAILHASPSSVDSAEFNAAVSKVFDGQDAPSPEQCETMLDHFGIADGRARALLEDYKFYVATGTQRRPEVWRQRDHWSE